MSDLQRKKDILRQLVKARDAVRRKYNLLKFGRENFEKIVGETFKPIVNPLQELVTVSSSSKAKKKNLNTVKLENISLDKAVDTSPVEINKLGNILDEETAKSSVETNKLDLEKTYSPNSTLDETFKYNDHNENDIKQINRAETTFETAGSEDEENDKTSTPTLPLNNKHMSMLDPRYNKNLDKIYGVRKEQGGLMIGNTPITFEDKYIHVNDVRYAKTKGLLDLLISKRPNLSFITSTDLHNYKEILQVSSVHKKKFDPNESLRTHNSIKFNDFISPLFATISPNVNKTQPRKFPKKGGKLLPRYKIARRNTRMDYVYWDDPNELVDRLRLLMAERSAGNPSHTNEIHSIIEELREAGYIY